MKLTIVEAMKLKKRLIEKAEDLRKKVQQNCALMEGMSPMYPDQKAQVSSWLQSHRDIVKHIEKLGVAIQRTNLATNVTVLLGGTEVTKNIAEWVLRRRELAPMDLAAYTALSDRGLKEQALQDKQTGEIRIVKVLRFYDPKDRDALVNLFSSEPSRIDAKLEVANATTFLVDELDIKEDALG